jgi:hypothetical protein
LGIDPVILAREPFKIPAGGGSVAAAEGVDEAAVALRGLGGWGEGERAEKAALFSGLEAGELADFGLAIEGMGDGSGATLVAEGEDLDLELATFVADAEHVAEADLAGGLGGLAVRDDAVELAGLRGLFAGLEEAGGPEPLIDAGAGHGSILPFSHSPILQR